MSIKAWIYEKVMAIPEKKYLYNPKTQLRVFKRKAHLRIRTTTFASVMRIRSSLSFQIHKFFPKKGSTTCKYSNNNWKLDAEGAGEMSPSKHIKLKKNSFK